MVCSCVKNMKTRYLAQRECKGMYMNGDKLIGVWEWLDREGDLCIHDPSPQPNGQANSD